jgi:protein AFG1
MYLYGGVGSGKTMMMNLFHDHLPITSKKRIHFHAFMQDIHARVQKLRMEHKSVDAIPLIAQDIATESWVLCFDEFQVTDIADAMILRRLIHELMERNVVMVTTSNRHPDDLYKNGIQRDSFVPCIELLKERCQVVCIDSSTDYRRLAIAQRTLYFYPLEMETQKRIDLVYKELTFGRPGAPLHALPY